MPKKLILIYFGLTGAMLFWAVTFIWVRQITDTGLSPNLLIGFRLCVAASVMLLIFLSIPKSKRIQKKHIPIVMLMALFEPFLYYIGETNGIKRVSPTISAFIIATIPVFLPFIARFFIRERLSRYNYLGFFLSFLGIIAIIFNRNGQLISSVSGLAFLFIAVFSAIGYTIISKKLLETYSPLLLVSMKNIIGAIYFIPVILFFEVDNLINYSFTPKVILYIILMAICGNFLAYFLLNIAIKHIGASKSSVFANLIPVFTIIFSFFILGEILPLIKFIGVILILFGIFVAQLKVKR